MKTALSLFSIVLLAAPLVAQDAPIPQDLPLELRKTGEAVRRRVELPAPRQFPGQGPTNRSYVFLNRLRLTSIPALGVHPGSVEERIAALEAKVDGLKTELEAQKASLQQVLELLQRQQKD